MEATSARLALRCHPSQTPFGSGLSYVALKAKIHAAETADLVANMVFYDEFSNSSVGLAASQGVDLCCTEQHLSADLPGCASEGDLGSVIVNAPRGWPKLVRKDLPGEGNFEGKGPVHRTGVQKVLFAVCAKDSSASVDVAVDATVTFRNPYGFVPGAFYAMLPWWGSLFCGYALFLLAFGTLMLMNREHLLRLQYVVLGVGFLGLLETITYFIMYLSNNATGAPTCCPVASSVIAAAVLSVFKTSGSGIALFAVCLGFGVVHEKLTRSQTLQLLGLWLLLLAFGINSTVRGLVEYQVRPTLWQLPVVTLNFILIFGVLSNLTQTTNLLRSTGQTAKVAMYERLSSVLNAFVFVWFLTNIAMVLVAADVLPINWRWQWVFERIFDLLYFLGMVTVAYIWAPSARTQQYLQYSQPVDTGDMDAESRDMVEEVHAGGGLGVDTLDEAGEGDIELVVQGTPSPTPGSSPPTSSTPRDLPSAQLPGDEEGELDLELGGSDGGDIHLDLGSAASDDET